MEWEAQTGMCQWSTSTFEKSCGCTARDMPDRAKGNDRANRLAGKATLTSGLHLGKSEVLRNLRHYLRAQGQGHHTIDRLEERGMERGFARRYSLIGRERAIVNQTNIGTVLKSKFGKTGWSAYRLYRLNWFQRFGLTPESSLQSFHFWFLPIFFNRDKNYFYVTCDRKPDFYLWFDDFASLCYEPLRQDRR